MPSPDPYETLGVARDATPEEIIAAYRRAAKDTHPDVGGSPEAFDRISSCKELLLNPTRRQQYDQTGQWGDDRPDNPLSGPIGVLATFFDAVAQQFVSGNGPDPVKFDMVASARGEIGKKLTELRKTMGLLDRHIESLREMARRLEDKAGKGHIGRAILWRVDVLIQQGVPLNEDIDHHTKAIEMLKDYSFKQDAPTPPPSVYKQDGDGRWQKLPTGHFFTGW